jgi:hypothetical protein
MVLGNLAAVMGCSNCDARFGKGLLAGNIPSLSQHQTIRVKEQAILGGSSRQ